MYLSSENQKMPASPKHQLFCSYKKDMPVFSIVTLHFTGNLIGFWMYLSKGVGDSKITKFDVWLCYHSHSCHNLFLKTTTRWRQSPKCLVHTYCSVTYSRLSSSRCADALGLFTPGSNQRCPILDMIEFLPETYKVASSKEKTCVS